MEDFFKYLFSVSDLLQIISILVALVLPIVIMLVEEDRDRDNLKNEFFKLIINKKIIRINYLLSTVMLGLLGILFIKVSYYSKLSFYLSFYIGIILNLISVSSIIIYLFKISKWIGIHDLNDPIAVKKEEDVLTQADPFTPWDFLYSIATKKREYLLILEQETFFRLWLKAEKKIENKKSGYIKAIINRTKNKDDISPQNFHYRFS